MRTIEESLAAFKLADLQTFRNICITIKMDGHEIIDVIKYITSIDQRRINNMRPPRLCPECNGPMLIGDVNSRPCNQVGGGHNSHWFCSFCGYEEFSDQSVKDELEKHTGRK